MTNTDDISRIALTGKMRSGKSTVANYLAAEHGFECVSFGAALKRYADELFSDSAVYPTEYIEIGEPCPFGGKLEHHKRKPRRLYQDFGQAMRALDPDVWVRLLAARIGWLEAWRSTTGIVIEDLRQPNEYEWAKVNGFTIIRVNANEDTRLERAKLARDVFSVEDLRHETEMHVDDFKADYDLWNDEPGDLAQIKTTIDEIVSNIKAER